MTKKTYLFFLNIHIICIYKFHQKISRKVTKLIRIIFMSICNCFFFYLSIVVSKDSKLELDFKKK